MTNYSRSVLLSNGQIRGENLRNGTLPGSKKPSPKARFSIVGAGFAGAFHTLPTNAATLVSRGCGGLHTPPQPLTAHTAAHRAKHGRFGWGRYHYPRSVLRGSETLRGRVSEWQTLPLLGLGQVCAQRTQRAIGTAMRSCASLSRGVAAPLGCVIPLLFLSPH